MNDSKSRPATDEYREGWERIFENRCCNCGTTEDLKFGPDPYAEDINGDDTPVWECHKCREESASDI